MTGLTQCSGCGAAVPPGAFCAVCGHALAPPTPSEHAEGQAEATVWRAAPAPAPPTAARPVVPASAPPGTVESSSLPVQGGPLQVTDSTPVGMPSRRSRLDTGSSRYKAGAAVALILAAGFFVFGRGESHTLTGDLTLIDSDVASLDLGDSCTGQGGYDDISPGAEIVVEDESGTTLATSHLATGTYDGLGCVFEFSVDHVGKASFYRVMIGSESRGGLRYSHDELAGQDWAVHLSLGD